MLGFSPSLCCTGLLALLLLLNGCGGRAVSKKLARDVIADSPAGALARDDVEVLSVTQAGAREAIVETSLHTAFRLEKSGGKWLIREVRVGQGQWERLDEILSALERIKVDQTRRLLEQIAKAIEAYRQKNGRLPSFKNYVDLSDALYPLFLSPLIREDAWRRPLTADRPASNTIRLLSAGPDGVPNTADDIELTRIYGP